MTQCIKYSLLVGLLSIGGCCVAAEEIPQKDTGAVSGVEQSGQKECFLCFEEYPAERGVRISGNCERTVCSKGCYQKITEGYDECGFCRKELTQPPVQAIAPEKGVPAKARKAGKAVSPAKARKARLDMLFLAASRGNFVRIAPIAKGFAAQGGITQAEYDALRKGATAGDKAALLATIKALRAKKN